MAEVWETYRYPSELIDAFETASIRWDRALKRIREYEDMVRDGKDYMRSTVDLHRGRAAERERTYRVAEQQMARLIEHNGPVEHYGAIYLLADTCDESPRRVQVLRATSPYLAELPECLKRVEEPEPALAGE